MRPFTEYNKVALVLHLDMEYKEAYRNLATADASRLLSEAENKVRKAQKIEKIKTMNINFNLCSLFFFIFSGACPVTC